MEDHALKISRIVHTSANVLRISAATDVNLVGKNIFKLFYELLKS